MLNLVLDYESSALAAPQSFRDAMQTAANILDSTIYDNITVTIQVGYGDYDNNLITGLTTSAVGLDAYGSNVSYTTLHAALASHETSALDQTFVNSLPNTSTINGVSSLYVPSAIEKALGMISPTASAIDGYVGIGTSIPTTDLVGVALHELTHALGRDPYSSPFDLTRYTSPGDHLFSTGSTAPAAYFSIDGGVTKLADYGQNSDPSDFLNSGVQGPNDAFNEYYSSGTAQSLSTVDKQLLDAMGFDTTTPISGTGYNGGTTSSSGGTTTGGTSSGGHKPKKVAGAGDGTGDDSGHHNFVFAPASGSNPVAHSPTVAEGQRDALLAEIGSLSSTENHAHLSDLSHSFLATTAAELHAHNFHILS